MANDDMCKQIGLLSCENAYYFQARIPQDIGKQFPLDFSKPVIRKRLTATTLAEAKAQVRQLWADLETRFKALGEPPKTHLPEAEANRFLRQLWHLELMRTKQAAGRVWTNGR